jgi:GTP cyclohydrolase I
MKPVVLSPSRVEVLARGVAERVLAHMIGKQTGCRLYGVPRGGVPAAFAVAHEVAAMSPITTVVVDTPEQADFIIDDIIDSGSTKERYRHFGKPFFALVDKAFSHSSDWVVFPWEGTTEGSAEDIPRRLLQFVGENPDREGLQETPARFLKAWQAYTKGYHERPQDVLKVFEDGAERYDSMVVVRDIPVYSHCEHHLAPFFGKAHVAYIPNGKVVGLSKLARLVDVFARRLQVQERLTQQVAHALDEVLAPRGVGVILECRHMCMEARGVKTPGTSTVTSCLLGAIKDEDSARAELLRLVR